MRPAIYPVVYPDGTLRGRVTVYGARPANNGRYAHRTLPVSQESIA
jgi:hypothetical protein